MNKKVLLFPIKYGIIYSLFTFMMYLFGVWKYPDNNRLLLIIYILLCNIVMYFAFMYGAQHDIHIRIRSEKKTTWNLESGNSYIWKFYKICFWCTFLLFIPRFIIFTGLYNGFNLSTILNKIQFSISDVNQAYIESHNSGNSATGIWRIINQFCVFGGGLVWCYTPLTVILWKKLKKSHKIFAICYWMIYCIQYIISATNSGVVGQIFYIAVSVVFMIVYRRKDKQVLIRPKRERIRIILVVFIGICLIMSIFDYAMSSRVGINYRNKQIGTSRILYNENSVFNMFTPESFHPTIATADSYLTQGYNAVEMSFSLPWEPTFFLGSSRFIMDNFAELTGIEVFNYTYQMRLYEKTGWHYGINWHTAYLWLANDFSIWGVPIFLFILFLYFGTGWRSFIIDGNIIGFLCIVLFAQFMFYISANNNLFSYSDTLFAFIIVGVLMINSDKYDWGDISL